MRLLKCHIEYLGEADVLNGGEGRRIERGGVISTLSKPMKATLYEWTLETETYSQADLMENVTFEERPDGSYVLSGDSLAAERSFGVGNSKVDVLVTPAPGCINCA